jgi:hypothetical protein
MILMDERTTFQFRMRDLLWAVSLIGVALGSLLGAWRILRLFPGPVTPLAVAAIFLLFELAIVSAGSAFGALFRHPKVGALWGFAVGNSGLIVFLREFTRLD